MSSMDQQRRISDGFWLGLNDEHGTPIERVPSLSMELYGREFPRPRPAELPQTEQSAPGPGERASVGDTPGES